MLHAGEEARESIYGKGLARVYDQPCISSEYLLERRWLAGQGSVVHAQPVCGIHIILVFISAGITNTAGQELGGWEYHD